MTKSVLSLALLAIACLLHALPAQAQTRVFVAAQGSDSNPCTFALPCRTFQHAHDIVAANGEIDVLDPAGYGTLIITKAITIQGHEFSGISVSSGHDGIYIFAPATDKVSLRGLLIDGAGAGRTGITFQTAKSLTIENCVVRNFVSSGIAIGPTVGTVVAVTNTIVADNGGHGIYVQPNGAGSSFLVNALFNRVEVYDNALMGIGVFGNLLSGGAGVSAIAIDTVAGFNNINFYALGNGPNAELRVFRSTSFRATATNSVRDVVSEGGAAVTVSQSNLEGGSWVNPVASYGDNYSGGVASGGGVISKQ